MTVFEMRTYRAASTPMLAALHDRMQNHVIPLFAEHDIEVVAAFEVMIGVHMPSYVYLIKWRDLAHREKAFANFYADERWRQIRKETNEKAGGEMLHDYDVTFLSPAEYSPLR